MSMSSAGSDLVVGMLGMGMRGVLGGHAHRPGNGSVVGIVCDPAPAAAVRAREAFGESVEVVTTLAELIAAAPDAVIVATPDDLHEEQAIALLEAGIAAYVEKPLAITVEGADRVLAAAMRSGSRLYVGHNMRHLPVVLLMREIIARGEIGEVKAIWCRHFVGHGGDFYFKDWHAESARGTGLLLQKGAHDIDVIHWLAGGYTRRVSAMGGLTLYGAVSDRADRTGEFMWDWFSYDSWPPGAQRGLNPRLDVEDLSMVTMALDNGVFATYQQCHYTPDYWRNYTVIGTEGRLENFGDGAEGSVVKVWNRRHDWDPDGDAVYRVPIKTGGHGGADAGIMTEFLDFVRVGGTTNTSPVAAREAVATGVCATHSLRQCGIPIDVPLLPADEVAYFESGQR